jgi:5,10-methylenetetrahydromethanopterin reductase
MAPPLARFQVISGSKVGPTDSTADANLEAVRQGYDMTKHGEIGSKDKIKGGPLSPDFVRQFAIVGPPDHCTERLLALRAMGLERFVVVGPGFYPADWGEAAGLFPREVIPALRAS